MPPPSLTGQQKSALAWGVVAAAVVVLLRALGPVLTPFVVASVLAYVLTPVVDRCERLLRGHVPRLLVVVGVEAAFLGALLGLLLLLLPVLTREWPLLRDQVPVLLDRLDATLGPWLAQYGIHVRFDPAGWRPVLQGYFSDNFEQTLDSVLSSLKIGGSVALAVFGNLILTPVALFYLLLDWAGVVRRFEALVPMSWQAGYRSFVDEADGVLGQYLRGQLLVMATLAVYYSVALAAFGLDLALPIGVFTGLAIFVPYVGYGIGLTLATLAGVLQFTGAGGLEHVALMLVTVYGTGQVLEGFFLTPRLVGERIGLHPLGVIFALLAFGQLFGFIGVLVALPSSAVLLVGMRRLRARYFSSRFYQQ